MNTDGNKSDEIVENNGTETKRTKNLEWKKTQRDLEGWKMLD